MRILGFVVVATALWISPARAESHLDPLAFLHGCWNGAFAGVSALRDERCFTPMNNGAQVRDVHTVVGSSYGGETIYAWDGEQQRIVAIYYANDGGLMHASVRPTADGLEFPDARHVGADGRVIQLRSRWTRLAEDRFRVISERMLDGAWAPFSDIEYVRADADRADPVTPSSP
ncbi:MAG: hypothetical protein GC206_07820 [Alphaproteobacteria bacterium]|nr:hypothetical protein [Alphaproteobacteria bacterium]